MDKKPFELVCENATYCPTALECARASKCLKTGKRWFDDEIPPAISLVSDVNDENSLMVGE